MLPSEQIKEHINIVDFINEYVPLKKAGVNFRSTCPFHQEKTPSFIVSPAKQIWHCFGCSLGGDVFEFVKQIEGVEFPEALQILAARTGVVLRRPTASYQKETDQKKVLYEINELAAKYYQAVLEKSQSAEKAREYLGRRGFKSETIKHWQLGYAPDEFHAFEEVVTKKGFQKREAAAAGLLVQKEDGTFFDRFRNRIMFPLHDIHGRVVGFTARIFEERPAPSDSGGAGSPPAKYINSPETLIYRKGELLYGLYLAKNEIRKRDQAVVVEGNVDVITCHEAAAPGGQAGFGNVVGSSGTALTQKQLEILKRFTANLSFAFDVDEAGLQATRRAVESALAMGFNVRIISLPKVLAKDPDELIRKDPAIWQKQVAEAKNFLDFYFESVFANINLEESQEKKRATAELLPLLSLLPDPIDRAHYVQRLANKIGVDERIIFEILNKKIAGAVPTTASAVSAPGVPRAAGFFVQRKTKLELLERRVLGFMLKFAQSLQSEWDSFRVEDFETPILREIFLAMRPLVQSGTFGETDLKTNYPKLAPEIELLTFAIESELSTGEDRSLEDLKRQLFTELKLAGVKRKMQDLASRIRLAEQNGRVEEVHALTAEFNHLIQELSKYELVKK